VTAMDWGFDAVLAAVIPILAWRILASDDLPKSVVIFVAFGLVSTIAWARLDAPDVALVEAAIGAGLTGALLMNALAWIPAEQRLAKASSAAPLRWLHAAIVAAIAYALGVAILQLPAQPGLAGVVSERLTDGGVAHPVTAVLLNFRAYDTFLEIAVLLVAAITARVHAPRATTPAGDPLGSLVGVLARMLVPGIVLVAGYLVWRGADAPGGAFQAAAVLGGGGILLVLARAIEPPRMTSRFARIMLVSGFGWFLVVAAISPALGRALLEYPSGWAKHLILAIEIALTVSIAAVLVMFFPGEPSRHRSGARGELEDRW
jgi:multisubunit Na+/H+ antiporter MnhB subunit